MVVESGQPAALQPGRAFHFADRFKGGEAPESLPRSSDGVLRILLGDVRQPVLCAPAPYVLRKKLSLPPGAKLRTAFGLAPGSWNKAGAGVRFTVKATSARNTTTLLSRQLRRWQSADDDNWLPVTVELPAGDVEIELVTEIVGSPREGKPKDQVSAYALWLDPTVSAPAAVARPNIIVVLIDALRADHLGCYGYPRQTSPFLDSLAARGVMFEDANAQGTWTLPSAESLLTSSLRFMRGSQIASAASARDAAGEAELQPVSMPVSLQGELRDAGYETMACVGGGFLDPALGFDSGFDWYWSPKHTPMLPNQLAVVKQRLSSAGSDPFLLFLHTFEVHNYFQGWAHDIGLFDHGYLGPLTDPRRLMDADLHADPQTLTSADRQYLRDLYDGEIHHTDRYLSLFFGWVSAQPWAMNTIIVVTADHGEGLGDHGAISHGGVPYRDVVRVPLIISSGDGRRRGVRVKEPVALSDLMPTLLELAGAPSQKGLVGESLAPLMQGRALPARPIFCESRGNALMVRDGRWWYLTFGGERPEELYDTSRDPEQRVNKASSSPTELARMRQLMAGSAMRAARGYRLVVAGRREKALTLTLETASSFTYLDMPTRQRQQSLKLGPAASTQSSQRQSAASGKQQVTVELPAGADTQVLLFEPGGADAGVTVSASWGGTAVDRRRFHLGASARTPESATIVIGAAGRALLLSDAPPVPVSPDTWGIWIWLPPTAAEALRPQAIKPEELPEDLREQLKSLGYLR
jgi:arylsulfatase A-like enzyme